MGDLSSGAKPSKDLDLDGSQGSPLPEGAPAAKEGEGSAMIREDIAMEFCRNMEYYRGLLDECAKHLGEAVYISDDGSRQDEPLRAKVPDLVATLSQLREENKGLREALAKYGWHGGAPGPICERAKHSEYPCTCGFEAVLASAQGAALSTPNAAPARGEG